jgi:hypothetical protein
VCRLSKAPGIRSARRCFDYLLKTDVFRDGFGGQSAAVGAERGDVVQQAVLRVRRQIAEQTSAIQAVGRLLSRPASRKAAGQSCRRSMDTVRWSAVGVAGPIRRQGGVAAAPTPRSGCEYAGSGPPLAARRRLDEVLAWASAVVMSLVSQQSDQF